MATADRDALLESVCRVARDAQPPALDPARGEQSIQRALDRSRVSPRRTRARAALFVGSAAAAAALLVILVRSLSGAGPDSGVTAPDAVAFTLPSGDRIAAATDAEFELASATASERRIQISRGMLRFEVRPLGVGERFEVRTPHVRVRVIGTVFSVAVREERTVVEVESGVVEVTVDGNLHLVGAGDVLDSARLRTETGTGTGTETETETETGTGTELGIGGEGRGSERTREVRTGGRTVTPPVRGTAGTSALDSPLASGAERRSTPRRPLTRTSRARSYSRRGAPFGDEGKEGTRTISGRNGTGAESGLGAARRFVLEGDFGRALAMAREVRGGDEGEWRMVEGDALRGLGRGREAAGVYLAAAELLGAGGSAVAGFLAASLFDGLGDVDAVIDALDRTGADREGSEIEERALGLRLRVLAEGGKGDRAREVAERYLERFPEGSLRELGASIR